MTSQASTWLLLLLPLLPHLLSPAAVRLSLRRTCPEKKLSGSQRKAVTTVIEVKDGSSSTQSAICPSPFHVNGVDDWGWLDVLARNIWLGQRLVQNSEPCQSPLSKDKRSVPWHLCPTVLRTADSQINISHLGRTRATGLWECPMPKVPAVGGYPL